MTAAVVVAAAAVAAAAAFMVVMLTMVVALDVGIVHQISGNQGLHCAICVAGNAAKQPDSRCCQSHLGAAANAAANQNIGIQCCQNASQSTMTAAIGIHHLRGDDLAILHIIDLELLCVAKMLENFSVFIGYCDSHCIFSFRFFIFLMVMLLEAAAAAGFLATAEPVIAAFDP